MERSEVDREESEGLNGFRKELHNLHSEIESNYTLSKEDFDNDFKGDNFKQGIGNCWMVSVLDSFVNYGDYENLIRTHVKKNNEGGYDITLPMGKTDSTLSRILKQKKVYHITREDLLPQVSIYGHPINLLNSEAKKGIQCLILAISQKIVGNKNATFDYNVLNGGFGIDAMNALMADFNSIIFDRDWMWDDEFEEKLKSYLKKFKKETDMMTAAVRWNGTWENMGDIDVNIHDERANHDISIDSVFYKQSSNGGGHREMWVRLSNPQDASDFYDMPYNKFKHKCGGICFGSKKYKKVENDYDEYGTYGGKFDRTRSKNSSSLNNFMQEKYGVPLDESGKDLRNLVIKQGYQLPDGRIVGIDEDDGTGSKCFIVNSYNEKVVVKEKSGEDKSSYVFVYNGIELSLDKGVFSDKWTSFGNLIKRLLGKALNKPFGMRDSDNVRFFTSAMEFSHYINVFKKSKCEGFTVKEGKLFVKFPFLDDYVNIPWTSLGLKEIFFTSEKMKIVDFLNRII